MGDYLLKLGVTCLEYVLKYVIIDHVLMEGVQLRVYIYHLC